MKFYRLNEVPTRSDDQVFKASSTRALIGFVLFLGSAITLLLLGIIGTKIYELNLPPQLFFYGGATICGLLAWFSWGGFRARRRPTNWLLRCNNSGVIIKYRSFENWRFPAEDVQAVGFDYSEISEVRMGREQRTVPGLGGNSSRQIQQLTYLDFRLTSVDVSVLETHILAEQKAEPAGRFKTIYRDYPVEVLPDGVIRLRWSISGGYGVHPSLGKAIEYLSRHIKTTATDSTKTDLTHQTNLSSEEGDAKILRLVKSGDKMSAVKLTRQIYGSSLDEAVAFVEKLQSGG